MRSLVEILSCREILTKHCPKCCQMVSISDWPRSKQTRDGLNGWCRACQNESRLKNVRQTRSDFLDHLGGECARCGFTDKRALQIDHINGGGTADRRRFPKSSQQFFKYVANNRDLFQLLCTNCNAIKRIENKENGNSGRPRTVMSDEEYRETVHASEVAKTLNRKSGMTKLTYAQSVEICERANLGEAQIALASEFGIDQGQVSRIKNQKAWKFPERLVNKCASS